MGCGCWTRSPCAALPVRTVETGRHLKRLGCTEAARSICRRGLPVLEANKCGSVVWDFGPVLDTFTLPIPARKAGRYREMRHRCRWVEMLLGGD